MFLSFILASSPIAVCLLGALGSLYNQQGDYIIKLLYSHLLPMAMGAISS